MGTAAHAHKRMSQKPVFFSISSSARPPPLTRTPTAQPSHPTQTAMDLYRREWECLEHVTTPVRSHSYQSPRITLPLAAIISEGVALSKDSSHRTASPAFLRKKPVKILGPRRLLVCNEA
ncbi:hypothetical protein AB1Y20_012627 [Prymnesium parvum]|uniref:Uncharacterized protein n=1 Tax=Prymnesium parvum TaxID=97485 RepID=A0AB34ILZ5_PRYPA